MGRRKNVGPQYIDICSNCDKEVEPYGDIRKRVTRCPDCGKRMIYTDDTCYEVVKLLKEINLKPIWANSFWMIDKDVVGKIKITVDLGMPFDEAMFSGLPNYKFYNKNSLNEVDNIHTIRNGSALQCNLDNITNEVVGVKYLGRYDVLQILDSSIKELKDWCEDYKENLEGRLAVGTLAGWFDY